MLFTILRRIVWAMLMFGACGAVTLWLHQGLPAFHPWVGCLGLGLWLGETLLLTTSLLWLTDKLLRR